MRTARGTRPSARERRGTFAGAGSRGSRRARSSSFDGLKIDVLQRGANDADAVDLLARGDELADDPRHVLAPRGGKVLHAVARLDLHPALPAQLVRRSL